RQQRQPAATVRAGAGEPGPGRRRNEGCCVIITRSRYAQRLRHPFVEFFEYFKGDLPIGIALDGLVLMPWNRVTSQMNDELRQELTKSLLGRIEPQPSKLGQFAQIVLVKCLVRWRGRRRCYIDRLESHLQAEPSKQQ